MMSARAVPRYATKTSLAARSGSGAGPTLADGPQSWQSLFGSLECELIERRSFQTKARMARFTWIEAWYNPRRKHSALGYPSPVNSGRRSSQPCAAPNPDQLKAA